MSVEERERLFADIVNNRDFFYRFAYKLTRNKDSAEDLLQDSILRAFEKIHQFEGGSIKAWVKIIIFRKFLNLCSRSAIVCFCDIEDYNDLGDIHPYLDVISVRQALSKLNEFDAKLIELYILGYDYIEIADSMNIPSSTARVKIHRIKEHIRLQK